MRMSYRFVLGVGLSFAAFLLRAEVLCFDCGTADSPVMPGYVRAVPGRTEKLRWEGKRSLHGRAGTITRTWNPKRAGHNHPPLTDELSCDYWWNDVGGTLTVAVPEGRYRVWLFTGKTQWQWAQVWDLRVQCGEAATSATFPGRGEARLLELTGTAGKDGLKLEFSTRSKFALNALIVAPEAEADAAEAKWISPIRLALTLLPPEELKKWKEIKPVHRPEYPAPEWTDAETERGFALFHRHWSEPVWPNQFPLRREIGAPVRGFGVPGEREILTVSIHPLRDFGQVDAVVSDLTGADTKIPASAVDLRYVRYMYARPNYMDRGTYYRVPDVLMPWNRRRLAAGENLRFWLSVDVPADAKPGLYRGTLRLKLDGRDALVPLTFRVAGIRLESDPRLVFGTYYDFPLHRMDGAPDAFSKAWWRHKSEAEMAHLQASGMNALISSVDFERTEEGLKVYPGEFKRDLAELRRFGLDKVLILALPLDGLYKHYMGRAPGKHQTDAPMPPKEFFDDVTKAVREFEKVAVRENWGERYYTPWDEPEENDFAVSLVRESLKAVRQVPGAKTYLTADPAIRAYRSFAPYLDVWCSQPFSVPREQVGKAWNASPQVQYWCYPNHNSGENDHTVVLGGRMTYGFGLWRSGFRTLIPWIYQFYGHDQWNYLDEYYSDFGVRSTDDGDPIPTAMWEAFRQGMQDGRCLYTLKKRMESARTAGLTAEAEAARKLLDRMDSFVPVQEKYIRDGMWTPESFDALRWELVCAIEKIDRALSSAKERGRK